MGAKEQALKDIKDYLTPKAKADQQRRRMESARWLPYADVYTYDSMPTDNFMLRISHVTDPNINVVNLGK